TFGSGGFGRFERLITTPAFHPGATPETASSATATTASMFPELDRIFGAHHLPDKWPERSAIDAPSPTLSGQFIHALAPFRPPLPATDARIMQVDAMPRWRRASLSKAREPGQDHPN
ncbi:MAG TPA: hypothetical protein VLI91_07965, partial [Roseiarcus sp.]|nr:hypothetical protein [Roseiarcus sp.]